MSLINSTVCVTGAGAGVDSVWEQEKPEARKILENAADSHTSGARFVSPLPPFANCQHLKAVYLERSAYVFAGLFFSIRLV